MLDYHLRGHENLEKGFFEGDNPYGIPDIKPEHMELSVLATAVSFNIAMSSRTPEKIGCHFFMPDYQFKRLWVSPDKYTAGILKYRFVCSPDYSLYTDYPQALQIYNHYRKHWLAAYWQSLGQTVIPTISWSDERSFKWCFDGEPRGGTVAVSSVGTQFYKESKRLFLLGFERMIEELRPEEILFYGDVPSEAAKWMENEKTSVCNIKAYHKCFD